VALTCADRAIDHTLLLMKALCVRLLFPGRRQRYLDLIVSDETRSTFRARSKIISALRRHLEDNGFLEVSARGQGVGRRGRGRTHS
jgi:hypothetical protein